jgi:hypothetical protein
MPRMAAETLEQRLLQRMKVDPVTGCWLWQAGRDKDGYGVVQYKRRSMRAHRAAWLAWRGGEIPKGFVVCHHCDTPACIRPSHLFCGTVSDNTRDAFSKGRRVPPKNLNPKYPHWLVKWARTRTRAYWKSRKRNARGDKFAK